MQVSAHPPATVRELCCSRDGRFILANCDDKTLRLFDAFALAAAATGEGGVPESGLSTLVRPLRELRDKVEGRGWVRCCFSHDGERVVGGSCEKSTYHLFHWVRMFLCI